MTTFQEAGFLPRAREITQPVCPEGIECEDATACTMCDHPLCPDHSDDFTTCTLGGLHCGDCRDQCRACSAAAFDEGRL